MGQGVITGQTTIFGEEADIDPQKFEVRSAPVADIYGTMMGQQITGGSTSTKDRWMVLRQAGADLRKIMLKAAAKKFAVAEKDLATENGRVFVAGKDLSATYGDLIEVASTLREVPSGTLKSAKDFKYVGRAGLISHDAREKSTGTDQYGIDLELPNMKTAIVVRSPVFGGKVSSFDATEVKKSIGVQEVFQISSGIAIVCERYWQAQKARSLLKIDWEKGINASLSSQQIIDRYRTSFKERSGNTVEEHGDLDVAFKNADSTVEADYVLPYLAHAAMEPMNCVADVKPGSCDIYSPNQAPTLIRNAAAAKLGLSREDVRVHTSKFLGGGFGRRSTLDFSMEAVEISQKIKGPAKVIWSREDDNLHSPMRPISVHNLKAAIKDNQMTGWSHDLGCESIMQQVMPSWIPLMLPAWVPGFVQSGIGGVAKTALRWLNFSPAAPEGAIINYKVSSFTLNHFRLGLTVPIHFWRSVGHSYTGFVVESFIDEVANKIGRDPFDYRRSLLPENSRLKKTLERVAELSNWKDREAENRHLGIACHSSFESHVSQVAEVEVEDELITVKKIFCVVDCGIAVNPDVVIGQMQSGIIYGLSAALHGEITLKDGVVEQSNFDSYPPLRITDSPEIIVDIIQSSENPTGVGEPGLPPVAAALANAVFKATGKRLRQLPLRLEDSNA